MSRLSSCLQELKASDTRALITFITAGDPDLQTSVKAMHALVAGGADIIELGIPFSDPEAEGPVIQAASERALAAGTRLLDVLSVAAEFRKTNSTTPVVLMGYLNSILRMGYSRFAVAAATSGVDGLIMVNLPPEQAEELLAHLKTAAIDLIFLLAPTTTDERADKILNVCNGFAYYVSLKGITGAGHLDVEAAAKNLDRLKTRTQLPIMVGFGIKTPEAAKALGAHADGVVVGALLVDIMSQKPVAEIPEKLEAAVRSLREGLNQS